MLLDVVAQGRHQIRRVIHGSQQGVGVVTHGAVDVQVLENLDGLLTAHRRQGASKSGSQQGPIELHHLGGLIGNRMSTRIRTNPANDAVLRQKSRGIGVDGAVHATVHKNTGRH